MTRIEQLRAASDEEAAALLVEWDRQRAAEPDADPFRRPLDLAMARRIAPTLKAGRIVYWS